MKLLILRVSWKTVIAKKRMWIARFCPEATGIYELLFVEKEGRKWPRTMIKWHGRRIAEHLLCRSVVKPVRESPLVISSRVLLPFAFSIRRHEDAPCRRNKYSGFLPGYCTWNWNWPRADASPRPLPQADCILITGHQPRVKTIVQELRAYALCDGPRRNGVYFISRTWQ